MQCPESDGSAHRMGKQKERLGQRQLGQMGQDGTDILLEIGKVVDMAKSGWGLDRVRQALAPPV